MSDSLFSSSFLFLFAFSSLDLLLQFFFPFLIQRRRFRKKKDFEEKWLPEEFAGIKKIQRLGLELLSLLSSSLDSNLLSPSSSLFFFFSPAKRSSQDTPVSLFHILVPTRTPEAIQRMLLESKQSEKQMETTSTSTTTTTATKAVENASQHHPKTQRTLIKKAQVPTPTKLPLSSRILKYKSPKRLMPMTKALAQEEERRKKCLQLDLFLQKQQETASDEAKEV